jgi:hypothetical protein
MAVPFAEPSHRYLELLSDADLAVLGRSSGLTPRAADEAAAHLRRHPELIEPALGSPGTFDQLFGPRPALPAEVTAPDTSPGLAAGLALGSSPLLLFAVAVHRGVADLAASSFAGEPFGAWRRIPVFDTADLRAHFADPAHRLFAVEHLASYTRVTSGPMWVHGERGRLRRVRYSEVDPSRLASLLDVVDDDDKPGIYRRLGDLALFLCGVFPDWARRAPAHPVTVERLVRSVCAPPPGGAAGTRFELGDISPLSGGSGLGGLLRVLGPRWYDQAAQRSPLPPVRRMLGDAAAGFEKTRRFLTLLTDHYLFPLRERWFGLPS